MKTRNSLSPCTVLVLASAFLVGVAGITLTEPFPASTKGGSTTIGPVDVTKIPAPPGPLVPMPFPNTAGMSGSKKTMTKVKFKNTAVLKAQDVPKITAQMEEELAAVGEALQAWKGVSDKLNEEQRARLEATIKMYEGVKANLIPLVRLRAQLQVDLGVLRQLSEDIPKVTAALDKALGFVLEKVEDFAERRDKGEDAGLPERIAITILENIQEAFGNLKKDTERILNDAKKSPKHYRDEFRRLNDNLAAACAEFEEAANQAAAFHSSNLAIAKSMGDERGTLKDIVTFNVSGVKAKANKIVFKNAAASHKGSAPIRTIASDVAQTKVEIK